MKCRKGWLMIALVVWASAAWAADEPNDPLQGLTDWLMIPGFAVEATLGTGVKETGELIGEAKRFLETTGTIYCHVDAIGLEDPQTVSVVWFREADERARSTLKLTREKRSGNVMLQIPPALAGSWRVEVQDNAGQVLTLVPFVMGKPSVTDESPRKSAPDHK